MTTHQDTPQQKAVLRQCSAARWVRENFPEGSEVVRRDAPEPRPVGVVERHVPNTNAQGGHLNVRWSNGQVGRVGPGTVERVR